MYSSEDSARAHTAKEKPNETRTDMNDKYPQEKTTHHGISNISNSS